MAMFALASPCPMQGQDHPQDPGQGQSQNQPQPPHVPSSNRSNPIAIVPIEGTNTDAKVTGALQVTGNTAFILSSGSVTSGSSTTNVVLPRRGVLRVCASTSVNLSSDSSVPAGEMPGMMIALDRGALEASFATGRNSDVLLTPDFRILIGGPGPADLKVRLGEHGDTCVDNAGVNAPYVVVSSVFEGGAYRVQPGQRVMFQHGSLKEVVDKEKEPCGCPVEPRPASNDFPFNQSAGLSLKQPQAGPPAATPQPPLPPSAKSPFVYPPEPSVDQSNSTSLESTPMQSGQVAGSPRASSTAAPTAAPKPGNTPTPATSQAVPGATASAPQSAAEPQPAAAVPARQEKPGVLRKIGRFFRRVFGGD